jgi:hypothetical protein
MSRADWGDLWGFLREKPDIQNQEKNNYEQLK